jgi:secreted PhoX family phosphatase
MVSARRTYQLHEEVGMVSSREQARKRELDQEVGREIFEIQKVIRAEADACAGTVEGTGREPAPATARLLEAPVDRRTFIRGGVSSAVIAGTLGMFSARRARASTFDDSTVHVSSPYGEPVPTIDEVTGLPLIGLPPGFRYWSHGWTGDRIFPHLASPITPALHDGMGVLAQAGFLVVLCRNHEVDVAPAFVDGGLQFSPNGGGGNTNLLFDTRRRKWVAVWPTLSGTVRNCAGGVTPHASWLSCEETGAVTLADPADPTSRSFRHGWVFEVPAILPSNGEPIRAMGRRNHEAAAVDPKTDIV